MRSAPIQSVGSSHCDRFKLLIDGRWVEPVGGKYFPVHDPYLEQDWGQVALAGAVDVDTAVQAARRAFEDRRWSGKLASERAECLYRYAELIAQRLPQLVAQQICENGKLIAEMQGVTAAVVADCRFYAGLPEAHNGATVPSPRPNFTTFTLREPIGVCAAITPWNTPLGLLGWKLFPALAAGNTMVIKPSEVTPTSTLMLAALATEAGIPDGVVNVVTGDGATGRALVEHPGVDKIAFTGSTATGQQIASVAALRSARVSLELGGKSPNVVFADADIDQAVSGIMAGVFAATGQSCMAGSRVLVQRPVYEQVCEQLAVRGQRMLTGDPFDPQTQLGPLASKAQLQRVMRFFDIAREERLHCVTGATRPDQQGYFVHPTVYRDVPTSSRLFIEEVFGPVVAMCPFESEADAIALASQTRYGLAAGIWTQDIKRAHRMLHAIRAGTVWVNNYRVMGHTMPFGGMGQSGIGREMGSAALDAYTEQKSVWIDTGNEVQFATGKGD